MAKPSLRSILRIYFSKNDPVRLFVPVVLCSFFIYIILCLIFGENMFTSVFFLDGDDIFMDFFNSIRDASQGSAVYSERNVIYPPMANLIFLILSRLTPVPFNNSSFDHRLVWIHYPSSIILIFVFTVLLAVALCLLIHSQVKHSRSCAYLLTFLLTFSLPVLFMFERGNIISLCIIGAMIYAFTYNSDKAWMREIGLLSLAFAFSLKIYPAIFGYFLLCDKRYKEAFRCSVYALLMLILPCFFFGGFSCFGLLIKNIFSFTSSSNVRTMIAAYLHIPGWFVSAFIYGWVIICAIAMLISPFVEKSRWKPWLLGVLTIIVIPSMTALYCWVFLLIPILLMLREYKADQNGRYPFCKKDWIYFCIMTLPFVSFPFRVTSFMTANSLLIYFCAAFLSIFAVTDTFLTFFRNRKNKKELLRAAN